MRILNKEKLIRKNGLYSGLVIIASKNNEKESKIEFEITEEFFHFKIFHKNFADDKINDWWTDSVIINLIKSSKEDFFKHPRWKFILNTKNAEYLGFKN